ncbi:16S rRNA (uracil(1498)-N(3))-methyltransferase [Buchnera aphidicola]|uniref:Ribosomal RNA small subunit methyltransferase E n=1 Tax=Buchnera aphidicola (Cinara strobi) TaxID=1921549 RepID=A0A3B1DWJ2_9GAMM|nr:16S rRNA (uracil(1498)-N(3))-methyltransferase [Buchnera aphidicola]VAX76673.1 Ribosomal RNA small subunit methyltransferase E [Buchnera aphidicola (Cinara strobi)]
MYIPRIYYNQIININTIIKLKKNTIHYCMNVLRLKIDNIIHLFNNTNYIFISKIIEMKKKNIIVKIIKKKKKNNESPINIHLGQIISKKMNITIEKSVELGVHTITPIFQKNKYSNQELKKNVTKKIHHWKKIIISACAQSQRNILPKLNQPSTISQWYKSIPKKSNKIIFTVNAKKKICNIPYKDKDIYILIGSEKGFSNSEVEYIKKRNFLNISLGPRTLRTETAGIAAITALQIYFGDIK